MEIQKKNKIKKRIEEIRKLLYVPPEGRMGGSWEKPLKDELARLHEYLAYF